MAIDTGRGKEMIIQNIKYCGQALIDDAENIVNSNNYIRDMKITCWVTEMDGEVFYNVDTDYYPKGYIERYTT